MFSFYSVPVINVPCLLCVFQISGQDTVEIVSFGQSVFQLYLDETFRFSVLFGQKPLIPALPGQNFWKTLFWFDLSRLSHKEETLLSVSGGQCWNINVASTTQTRVMIDSHISKTCKKTLLKNVISQLVPQGRIIFLQTENLW